MLMYMGDIVIITHDPLELTIYSLKRKKCLTWLRRFRKTGLQQKDFQVLENLEQIFEVIPISSGHDFGTEFILQPNVCPKR